MSDFVAFFSALLGAVSSWLGTGPIFYLFGLTCLLGVCKAVKILL